VAELDEKIAALHSAIRKCTICPLSRSRTQAVPGDGSLEARIMFVGEGPGAQEDREGKPFVGAAGKFLNELLSRINLSRGDVFITNVVKCRPPENRDPLDTEKEACLPYLRKQVSLIKPLLICTLGNHAMRTLIDRDLFISQVHGKRFTKGKYTFTALYHPAAALYQQSLKETLIEDFLHLGEYIKEHEQILHSQ
jgi:DNA polymerase